MDHRAVGASTRSYLSISGDTGEHILPIACGNGFNGKSTIWNVIIELAGDYGAVAMDSLVMGTKDEHSTEKAQLYQKRIVAISEVTVSVNLGEYGVHNLFNGRFDPFFIKILHR